MKRKILSLILVAAMLASMLVFAPAASATDAVATVDVTEAVAYAGDTVTLDVVITFASVLNTFQGVFEFDNSRLELVSRLRTDHWGDMAGTNAGGFDGSLYADFCSDGSFFSVYGDGGKANATDGVVAFTLTFQVKEKAPAGDALVTFRYLDERCALGDAANRYDTEVAYTAGCITVLPDSYKTTTTEGFTFTNNGDGTATIDYYEGEATTLVIPSVVYDGETPLTVTKIGPMVFCSVDRETYKYDNSIGVQGNDTIETIVVPATVTEIADFAFMNANVCTEVVFLGDTALGYFSVGTTGSWKMNGNANGKYSFLNDEWPNESTETDEDGAILATVTIKSTAAGSEKVAEYVNYFADGTFGTDMNDDVTYIVRYPVKTVKGATMTVVDANEVSTTYTVYGDAISAPVFAGSTDTLAYWQDAEGNAYLPGADLGDVSDITLTAVTVAAPTTVDGVSAKITETFGMRFKANVPIATYNTLKDLGGTVEMGMLITPRAYVNMAGTFTMEALDALGAQNGAYVKIESAGYYEATADTYILAGTLAGIQDKTASKNPAFAAIAYLTVTVGEDTYTVYGQYDYLTTQDAGSFLAGITEDSDIYAGLLNKEIGWINDWKTKFGQTQLTTKDQ